MSGTNKSMRSKGFALALGLGSTLLLAACQSQPQQSNLSSLAANDYRLRHPIMIEEGYENLDLPIGANTRSLSSQFSDRIAQFGHEARVSGSGAVEVLAPSGSANEAAVHALVPQIRKSLQRGGLGKGMIVVRSYSVEDQSANAPIRLAYRRMKATTNECGQWPKSLTGGVNQNNDYDNFGCATQANLAAMIENPADLIAPRASTAPDQMRRATVFKNYREGTITAADYQEGVGASVSE